MIETAFRFFATAFPGGYRFVAVFLITNMLSGEDASRFVHLYFWSGIIASFSGIPLASIGYSRSHQLSRRQQFHTGATLSLLTISVAAYWIYNGNLLELLYFSVAIMLMNTFEVLRTDLMNAAQFRRLFVAGAMSFFGLLLLLAFASLTPKLAIVTLFAPLAFSTLYIGAKESTRSVLLKVKWQYILTQIARFIASSGISTGLMFFLPIMLVREFGPNSAVPLARLFTVGVLFFFYPRVLSAKYIPLLRSHDSTIAESSQLATKIFFFAIASSVALLSASLLISTVYIQFGIYFLATQLTQVALPYSSVLLVLSRSNALLLINTLSALFFLFWALACYVLLEQSVFRGQFLSIGFFGSVVCRIIISSMVVRAASRNSK